MGLGGGVESPCPVVIFEGFEDHEGCDEPGGLLFVLAVLGEVVRLGVGPADVGAEWLGLGADALFDFPAQLVESCIEGDVPGVVGDLLVGLHLRYC